MQMILDWLNRLMQSENAQTQESPENEGGEAPEGEESPEDDGDSPEAPEPEGETMLAGNNTEWTNGLMTLLFGGLAPTAAATATQTSLPVTTAHPETSPDQNAFRFQSGAAQTPTTVTGAAIQAPNTTAVFWGDSIAHGMATSLRPGTFNNVVNLGTPGAGFLTSIKPQAVTNVPAGSVAIIYFGTNDVASLMGQSDAQIEAYARRVIEVAQQMKAQGAEPVILGLNAPKGAYTGGSAAWRQEGFVERWTATMERVNEQYRQQAEAAGIRYAATDAQITASHISGDNLHLTADGSRAMANIGIQTLKS